LLNLENAILILNQPKKPKISKIHFLAFSALRKRLKVRY
jgi:hypothetical protein